MSFNSGTEATDMYDADPEVVDEDGRARSRLKRTRDPVAGISTRKRQRQGTPFSKC